MAKMKNTAKKGPPPAKTPASGAPGPASAAEKPAGQTPPQAPENSGKVTPQSVRAQMKLTPQLQAPYERVVAAGRKLLYSEQMAPQIQELLRGPGDIGEKLGKGVVALMAILISQANGTMPPQIIIPAATELVAEAGDFLRGAGAKVTDGDVAEGMAVMVQEILSRSGITPDKIPQLLKQGGAAPQPAAAAAPQPGAPVPQGA